MDAMSIIIGLIAGLSLYHLFLRPRTVADLKADVTKHLKNRKEVQDKEKVLKQEWEEVKALWGKAAE